MNKRLSCGPPRAKNRLSSPRSSLSSVFKIMMCRIHYGWHIETCARCLPNVQRSTRSTTTNCSSSNELTIKIQACVATTDVEMRLGRIHSAHATAGCRRVKNVTTNRHHHRAG